ncbi:polysaccharide biosynthesis tyrosine autokinase [Mycolicibacterium sp. PAM1]|uniref:polysaccharide biosynthesis tyrosine autokinase n=1 Tax=Mycolicibacterium sp. PAM1 TaxID=2853535 RepID=UPI001C3D842E|nr:polysaccharide biosynthesis tyrosine autokinase [Mycolicibacterium sp. PAM1]MBV5246878.1 polysaccharide biosynthesis tyrosine autokinase [Mycolicibacterium sp. PAM1]
MTAQDFLKLVRQRWVTVAVVTVIGVLGGLLLSLTTTPLYQASTRLFVSTTSGSTLSDIYQGNRLAQERVISYAQLLMGETLAQRTIDKLGLNMNAQQLQGRVKASAEPDTVLIDVNVLDDSPIRARDIADTMSNEFVNLVRELETPPESGARPDARVVVEQRATIPSKPVVPKTTRNIAVGFSLGLLVGLGLALLRDVLDNTVKTQATIEDISKVGLVGSIPLDKERRTHPAITFESDNSGIAEAFRKLRTNLQFLAVDNPPRVIVLTSSVPSEGKSTTAINLALALAEGEQNVVLVDGDMRRPTLAKALGLVGTVGFSTVLSGRASLEDAIQKTRFPGLSVLTSGSVPPNPSELLGSQSARKLLGELRARYDYVIIDSTPLLAVTDAAILAAGADAVLMMARFGQTRREQLAHAVEGLASVGAPLLGAVMTMVPTGGRSSYNYQYAYYAEYSSQSSGDTARTNRELQKEGSSTSADPESAKDAVVVQSSGRRRKRGA